MSKTAKPCGCTHTHTHTHTHTVSLKDSPKGNITNISNVICDAEIYKEREKVIKI